MDLKKIYILIVEANPGIAASEHQNIQTMIVVSETRDFKVHQFIFNQVKVEMKGMMMES